VSLYMFIGNNIINYYDFLGLSVACCNSVRDTGFSTVGEQAIIAELENRGCEIPSIECRNDCPSHQGGRYEINANKVILCVRDSRTLAGYVGTRRHELSHALDFCAEIDISCGSEQDKMNLLCSEIKARVWGSGTTVQSEAVDYAIGSVMWTCYEDLTQRVDARFTSIQDQLLYNTLVRKYTARANAIYQICKNPGPEVPIPIPPEDVWDVEW